MPQCVPKQAPRPQFLPHRHHKEWHPYPSSILPGSLLSHFPYPRCPPSLSIWFPEYLLNSAASPHLPLLSHDPLSLLNPLISSTPAIQGVFCKCIFLSCHCLVSNHLMTLHNLQIKPQKDPSRPGSSQVPAPATRRPPPISHIEILSSPLAPLTLFLRATMTWVFQLVLYLPGSFSRPGVSQGQNCLP